MNVSLKKGLIYQKSKNTITLFDTENSKLYTFNGIGSEIIELIRNSCSADEIMEHILSDYDVTKTEVQNDVNAFIKKLEQDELINTVPKTR